MIAASSAFVSNLLDFGYIHNLPSCSHNLYTLDDSAISPSIALNKHGECQHALELGKPAYGVRLQSTLVCSIAALKN